MKGKGTVLGGTQECYGGTMGMCLKSYVLMFPKLLMWKEQCMFTLYLQPIWKELRVRQ